jgi:hypothetical protein
MTTLHEKKADTSETAGYRIGVEADGDERRQHRRHDMEQQGISVDRYDGARRSGQKFGRIVDLSAGGVRIRTSQKDVRPDGQIRLRLELPAYAGICPFVNTSGPAPQPTREWVGWLSIARVLPTQQKSDEVEIAGRLVDMDEMDRGMLGLYLSTQPLAA